MTRPSPARTRTWSVVAATALLAGGLATAVTVTPEAAVARPAAVPARASHVVPAQDRAATSPRKQRRQLTIEVLSGRADLVSDHSALVAVGFPSDIKWRKAAKLVRITVGQRDVTKKFVFSGDHRFEALVTGLHTGDNVVSARLNRLGASITLVDHPRGGPVLSGPQLQPWVCQKGAVDAQCNQPTRYAYSYKSTDQTKSGYQPYDPKNPPSDVARTKTDSGVTVPFIIRTETGYMDRDQYQVTALYQPKKDWTAVEPQPQFAHKMLVTHGASCGADHTTADAPGTSGTTATDDALGRGYVVMSTALDNSGHNCNVALQAESLIMAKEHVVKTYGTLKWTIGTGCSGGSLAEQWVANAYPGFYQGLLPTCSFPDAYSTANQFLDYHLLLRYFSDPSAWDLPSGVAWTPTQMGDVLGGTTDGFVNAQVSENAQFHVAVPTDTCAGVTDAQRYDPEKNPGGTRCTIQDAAINLFGPEEQRFWTAMEKKIGRGFVRLPVDNVGVQYGLQSLLAGTITPAMFVDLNVKAGGADVDTNFTAARLDNGGSASLANAYRTGLINEANNLDQVAIIDCRGTNPGLFHDTYRAFAVRARLDREHGTHANQVIWEGPVPLTADSACEDQSFQVMDQWLGRIAADHTGRTLAARIIANRPKALSDRCYTGTGTVAANNLCPSSVVPVEATPRMVAGDHITTDDNKCQLKPLVRTAYGSVTFTDAQWAELQKLYPGGVCDFSVAGVSQQDTIGWMTYQDAKGDVVYGGKPLGPPPASTPFAIVCHPRAGHRC